MIMATFKRVLLVGGAILMASGCSRCGRSPREAVPVPVPTVSSQPAGLAPSANAVVAPGSTPGSVASPVSEGFGVANPFGGGAPIETGGAPGQTLRTPQNPSTDGSSAEGAQRSLKSPQEIQEMGRKPMVPKEPMGTSPEAREAMQKMMERGRTPQPIPTGALPLPRDMKKIQESGSQPMIPPALAAPASPSMPSQRLER